MLVSNQVVVEKHLGFYPTGPIKGYNVMGHLVHGSTKTAGRVQITGDRINFISGAATIILFFKDISEVYTDQFKKAFSVKMKDGDVYKFFVSNYRAFEYKINIILRNPGVAILDKGELKEGNMKIGGIILLSFGIISTVACIPGILLNHSNFPLLVLSMVFTSPMIFVGAWYLAVRKYAR